MRGLEKVDIIEIRNHLKEHLLETKKRIKQEVYKIFKNSDLDTLNSVFCTFIESWSRQRYSSLILIDFFENVGVITKKESMDLQKWVHMSFGIPKDMNEEINLWIPFEVNSILVKSREEKT